MPHPPPLRSARLLVASLLLLGCVRAGAAECPSQVTGVAGVSDAAGATLDSFSPRVRLAFLREGMERAAHRARVWSWAWGATYSVLAVGQLALVPLYPEEGRPDLYLGAGASAVGLATLLIQPLPVMKDSTKLAHDIATSGAHADTCKLVREAETMLLRDAKMEERVHTWWSHAADIGFNLGVGLALAFGFHRYQSGAFTAAAGVALGELMLNTQPTESIELLSRYRSGKLAAARRPRIAAWTVLPSLQTEPGNTTFSIGAQLWF